jgi:hypothetical protein
MHASQAAVSVHAFWHVESFSAQAHAQVKKLWQSVWAHASCVVQALISHWPHGTSRSVPGGPSGHEGPENGKTTLPLSLEPLPPHAATTKQASAPVDDPEALVQYPSVWSCESSVSQSAALPAPATSLQSDAVVPVRLAQHDVSAAHPEAPPTPPSAEPLGTTPPPQAARTAAIKR